MGDKEKSADRHLPTRSRNQQPAASIQQPASSSQSAGLYIHVPFCIRKCRYCDFASCDKLSLQHDYADALFREMSAVEEAFPLFDTLYFGGGTPTAINSDLLVRIVETALCRFGFAPAPEVTVEANPGTVSAALFERLRGAGVNRLNIGVQSFCDKHLRFLGRIHSARDAEQCIRLARDAGFDNVGVDLIYGLPGQGKKTWLDDLKNALAFFPEHISCYMLTFEPGTPLSCDLAAGRIAAAKEETVAALFLTTDEVLTEEGYLHYEVSNFARSARRRSRHNAKYWALAPTLGLGPSAHTYVPDPPVRWWNTAAVEDYIEAAASGQRPVAGKERLTPEQCMIEAVYLALRTAEGIDPAAFEGRFGASFDRLFEGLAASLQDEGMLQRRGGRWSPTLRGMQFADALAQRFVERI